MTSWKHIIIKLSKIRLREFFKTVKRNSSRKREPSGDFDGFLSRNLAGQEKMGSYSQSARRKKIAKQEYFIW